MAGLAKRIISFYSELNFTGTLPPGIYVMNPFREDPETISVISDFYNKFFNDYHSRHLILGINPGRFGAGVTGIPFTDTVRLREKCGITINRFKTFELSSVFFYNMIERYGGVSKFYSDFYVSAVSPLGFTKENRNGRQVNYNYYDSKKLTDSVCQFIAESIREQLSFGILCDVCFCLGTGKNYSFLSAINRKHKFFDRIIPLEHPRFIMQYRSKTAEEFIEKYMVNLNIVNLKQEY
jgi:hypothetical protein